MGRFQRGCILGVKFMGEEDASRTNPKKGCSGKRKINYSYHLIGESYSLTVFDKLPIKTFEGCKNI